MNVSRRKFITLAGAAAFTVIASSRLRAIASGQPLDAELDRALPFPGQYGKDYNQAKINAFHLHNQPTTSPLHQTLEALWNDVFEQTNGELLVTVVPQDAAMPAGDPQAVRLAAEGRFEIVSVAGPIIDKLCPEVIGVQNVCFIYRSPQEVFSIINRPQFAAALSQAVAKYNLTYLQHGTFDNGMRCVTSVAGRPIWNSQDFKDLTIRVPPSNDIKAAMQALGAKPTEFTMNQVYQALKDKSVQAQENPFSVALGFKLYEVTKYLNMTNHAWSGYNTFFNTKFWQSLSLETQQVIQKQIPIYQAKQIQAQADYNTKAYRDLTQNLGMIATQPELGDIYPKLKPVYDAIFQQLSPQARDLIRPLLTARTGFTF